jgi:hypothetical protein
VTDVVTAAVEALAHRIRQRDNAIHTRESDIGDAEVFALEFITALRGHGWRPTAAKTAPPPLHTAPVPDKRSRDEELAAVRAEMAAKAAAAREAEEGVA